MICHTYVMTVNIFLQNEKQNSSVLNKTIYRILMLSPFLYFYWLDSAQTLT
jgi:hypothetical protein